MDLRGLAALSPAGLDALLDRLPAEQRAQLKWRAGEVVSGLLRLYEGEPTRERIVEVSAAFLRGNLTLHEHLATPPWELGGTLLPDLDGLIADDLAVLRAYVEPTAADAADWVWYGAWRPFLQWLDKALEQLPSSQVDDLYAAWRDLRAHAHELCIGPAGGIHRGLVLLLAAFRGARQHLDVAQTEELAYLAFEHACEGVDAAAADGIHLADTRSMSEDRAARAIRSAEALRAELTEEDMAILQSARLGDLR